MRCVCICLGKPDKCALHRRHISRGFVDVTLSAGQTGNGSAINRQPVHDPNHNHLEFGTILQLGAFPDRLL